MFLSWVQHLACVQESQQELSPLNIQLNIHVLATYSLICSVPCPYKNLWYSLILQCMKLCSSLQVSSLIWYEFLMLVKFFGLIWVLWPNVLIFLWRRKLTSVQILFTTLFNKEWICCQDFMLLTPWITSYFKS